MTELFTVQIVYKLTSCSYRYVRQAGSSRSQWAKWRHSENRSNTEEHRDETVAIKERITLTIVSTDNSHSQHNVTQETAPVLMIFVSKLFHMATVPRSFIS